MRNLILDYKYVPGQKTIDTGIKDLKTENIRLIVNETQHKIYCSSMQKQLVANILNGIVTIDDKFPPIEEGDKLTVEIDMGPDNNHAIEEELKHGKSKIAQNIIYKGGQSNENHSLGELADDVLTIPTPDVDIPVPTSDWERAAKAMWYSGLKYSYDIIAEYTKYQEVYKNNYPTQIIALYENQSPSTVMAIGLGNADAYYFSDGTFIDKISMTETHLFSEPTNNHYVIYLYEKDSSTIADFRESMTKISVHALYAKNCPFVKNFIGPTSCSKGIFFDCEDTVVNKAYFYGNCPFVVSNISHNIPDFCFNAQESSSYQAPGVFVSEMLEEANNAKLPLCRGRIPDFVLPNMKRFNKTFNDRISNNGGVDSFYLPNLQYCRHLFYTNGSTNKIKIIDLPELVEANGFVEGNFLSLYDIKVPKLKKIGVNGFLRGNIQMIHQIELPNLISCNGCIASGMNNLLKIKCSSLKNIGESGEVNSQFCYDLSRLYEIDLPELTNILSSYNGSPWITNCPELTVFNAPKLKRYDGRYGPMFDSYAKIWTLDLPSLEYCRGGIIYNNSTIHQIYIPKLSYIDGYAMTGFIRDCANLEVVRLGTLKQMYITSGYIFEGCPILHHVEIGPDTDIDINFSMWSPTGLPMDSKTNDLFNKDFMEGIVNNLKPTNLTHSIALSQNVKSRLYPDTIKALNDKHWVVA